MPGGGGGRGIRNFMVFAILTKFSSDHSEIDPRSKNEGKRKSDCKIYESNRDESRESVSVMRREILSPESHHSMDTRYTIGITG